MPHLLYDSLINVPLIKRNFFYWTFAVSHVPPSPMIPLMQTIPVNETFIWEGGGGCYKEKPMYSPSQNVLFLSTYKQGVIGFGPYGYGDISWQRTFHDRGDVLWHGTFHNEGRFVRGFFMRGRCVRERLAICAVCTSGSSIRGRFVCATLFLAFLLQERSTLFINN